MPEDRSGFVPRPTSRLEVIRRLSWPDRWLLVRAGLVVTVITLWLKVTSFQRVHAALLKIASPTDRPVPMDPGTTVTSVLRMAGLVNMASRHTPLRNSCLHRSLALWWLLNRRGFDGRLQFGARKRNGAFEAHAWVEHDGIIVSENPGEHDFVRLPWEPLKNDA